MFTFAGLITKLIYIVALSLMVTGYYYYTQHMLPDAVTYIGLGFLILSSTKDTNIDIWALQLTGIIFVLTGVVLSEILANQMLLIEIFNTKG